LINLYNSNLNFERVSTIKIRENTDWNYSYYPLIFESEKSLLMVQDKLALSKIYIRRYFYPSLNTLNFVEYVDMPVSEDISKRIACLPLYNSLLEQDVIEICNVINYVLENPNV
jgi:dTDP-4-amino-4,6-dideoxygalactose transaminase